MSEITKVAITKFDPNPYQPETRVQVKPEVAEYYGKSILAHGLLQMPLARQAPFGKKGEHYQMGDGWLRLQGFKWLVEHGHTEFQEITVEVREITDEAMAQLVFEANGVRKDLDPIETAQYFKKYMAEFKCTEAQLAEKHSISQGEVANTMRLLQLPTEIQYLVGSGAVPQTHARHLLRLNVQPETQKKMVQEVVKGGVSVNELSRNIDRQFWENSRSLNPKTDNYRKPRFDLGVCQGCVNRVQATEPYGQQKKEDRCLLVSCWDKKQQEAEVAEAKKAMEAAKQKGGDKILTSKTIDSGAYAFLDERGAFDKYDRTACKTCEKTALFKFRLGDTDKPQPICLDPACMRAKKSAFSRDKNKKDKIKDAELTEQLGKTFHQAHTRPTGVMIVVARDILGHMRAEGKRDMMRMFPELPKIDNGQMNVDAVKGSLVTKSLEDLTDLVAAVVFTNHRRENCYDGSNNWSTEIKGELKFELTQLDGTAKKYVEELTKWQEANCRGCNLVKQELIGSGQECCGQTYNQQIQKDGTCKYSPKNRDKKEKAEEEKATVEPKPLLETLAPSPALGKITHGPEKAAAGAGTATNIDGMLEAYVSQATLEDIAAGNSCRDLTEFAPKLQRIFKHTDGKVYCCTGSITGGKEGTQEADCYEVVLLEKFKGTVVSGQKRGAGYSGLTATYHGVKYVLTGQVVKFLPAPPLKAQTSQTNLSKTKEHLAGKPEKSETIKPNTETPGAGDLIHAVHTNVDLIVQRFVNVEDVEKIINALPKKKPLSKPVTPKTSTAKSI